MLVALLVALLVAAGGLLAQVALPAPLAHPTRV